MSSTRSLWSSKNLRRTQKGQFWSKRGRPDSQSLSRVSTTCTAWWATSWFRTQRLKTTKRISSITSKNLTRLKSTTTSCFRLCSIKTWTLRPNRCQNGLTCWFKAARQGTPKSAWCQQTFSSSCWVSRTAQTSKEAGPSPTSRDLLRTLRTSLASSQKKCSKTSSTSSQNS